ncbi:MAG TPA: ABC transporter permease subunit [Verrucomicrobiae bacterium]|jgi:oligopeptide transport system permease protein|nr:ABC transporter permease subunit [Verrucomicrobiae bacterium]
MSAEFPTVTQHTGEVEAGQSLWQDAWHRLRQNKLALIGACFIALLTIACFLTPLIAPGSYEKTNLALGPAAPSHAHWLGTDILGRDMLSRILFGGCISLSVGLAATLVSVLIGVLYGAISGYVGGRLDVVMMRVVDIAYSLPFVVFVILILVVFGRNIVLLFMAIGAVSWLDMARIVRGQVMSLKKQEFVEAAVALGLRKRRIILRHMIPNVLGIVAIYATLIVPSVMLLEAFLSFLGLGVQAPMSSWGTLINDGRKSMEEYPWLLIYPSLFFSLTLFSLNFLGDGLRDALDVRASKD